MFYNSKLISDYNLVYCIFYVNQMQHYHLMLCLLSRGVMNAVIVVLQAVMWDFQYGIQYAWMLVVFAVVMAYSIPCPLITPFGKLHHHVPPDYNIYYVVGSLAP